MSQDEAASSAMSLTAATARIRELEMRLEETEDTLEAIRRGDFDAVVVQGPDNEQRIYTLDTADRPYRALIEQIREGAFTLAADGRLLYCNRQLAELFGVRQERLIGRRLDAFFSEADAAVLASLLAEALDGAARGELTIAAGQRAPQPAYLSLSLLARDESQPILCGVLTDLTEQKMHLRELSEANTRLQSESAQRERVEEALRQSQKMEAVGQLTGGVAHDFNNLLTIIRSSVDLLRRPSVTEARRERYLEVVSDTVDRASRLTSQLLAFARRSTLKPEIFDLGEKLGGVADMLDTVTGARIRVVTALPERPCFVRADLSQFETALVNMAVNARDAMDGEGLLTLQLACGRTLPSIRGHGGSDQLFAVISLTDTGAGIAPDQIKHVFEPFYTTKEIGKGTGLGLSQVFGFVKQSGGDVDVESRLGLGTTFTLYLPEVEAPVEQARAAAEEQEPQGSGQRVLVVEDNIGVGEFCTQMLQDLGYRTHWAMNAEEALATLGESGAGFDVVFSDVVMPGMGGVALAEELRRRLPWLPVVLTSGYSHVLARDAGHGFDLLHKPYSAEQLSRMLRKAALRRHA